MDHIWGNHSDCGLWYTSRSTWYQQTMDSFAKQQNTKVSSLKLLAMKAITVSSSQNWKDTLMISELKEEVQVIIQQFQIIEKPIYPEHPFLREKMEEILSKFSTDNILDRLQIGASIQGNEALNGIHASLGGKQKYWGEDQCSLFMSCSRYKKK